MSYNGIRSESVHSPPRRAKVNCLFTSVGRRVELLRAFRRAYEQLGLSGNLVGIDIDPLAPGLQVVDRCYLVPRLHSSEYMPSLVRLCEREHVGIIFPLIDPDIPVLAQHRAELGAVGARMAVVSEEAARTISDKWLTMEFFRDVGVPTPQSWLPNQLEGLPIDYPLFIKPRTGSAAKYTYPVRNECEFKFFSSYVSNPLLQEYLPGPEVTNDVICDLDGKVLAVVSRQRMEVRWGEVAKGFTVYDERITDACIRIAQALPAVGPITIQCIMKEGVPHFTEINARMGGGLPLALAAGVNVPEWLLASIAGLPVDIPPLGTYEVGLSMTRYDESFFLPSEQREKLANSRVT